MKKILPDGRVAETFRRMFNTIIVVREPDSLSYDNQW